jgi:hypothetical protein
MHDRSDPFTLASTSELSTLLLEVAARRAAARTPAAVRHQYERDRFVRPSKADPRVLNAIEAAAFDAAEGARDRARSEEVTHRPPSPMLRA